MTINRALLNDCSVVCSYLCIGTWSPTVGCSLFAARRRAMLGLLVCEYVT